MRNSLLFHICAGSPQIRGAGAPLPLAATGCGRHFGTVL